MINELLKNRSNLGCFNAALNLYSENFSKIFHETWLWTLFFSLINGLFSAAGNMMANTSSLLLLNVTFIIYLIISILLDSRIKSSVLAMINGDSVKNNFPRILKVNAVTIAALVITILLTVGILIFVVKLPFISNLSASTGIMLTAVISICIGIIALLFISPFAYSITRYLLTPNMKFSSTLMSTYKKGLSKVGFIFSNIIIMLLITLVFIILLCIPAVITNIAYQVDTYGIATGDPSGLPYYFPLLNGISSMLMAFVLQYISLYCILVLCYTYGNLETFFSSNED